MSDPLCPVHSSRGPLMDFRGREFYPFDPRPEDIRIEDVAYMLARTRRFSNQSDLTVAQHSMIVAALMARAGWTSPIMQKICLLHDAHEAYIGDFPRPLGKRLFFIVDETAIPLDALRAKLDAAIYPALMPELNESNNADYTRRADCPLEIMDNVALLWEARDLLQTRLMWVYSPPTRVRDQIPAQKLVAWSGSAAEREYLIVYRNPTALPPLSAHT